MPETLDRIGPYRLLRKLGEGGMGAVHLGLDHRDREVAIKVLHPHVAADLKARDRLTREVETMRRVRSPRVCEVVDADLSGATPYIVTSFVPGRTLEQTVLEGGPLAADQVIRLTRGLCEALVAIHAAHVIHRDLKPANVMLVDGDPVVIDFGIAHLVNATRLTQTGMFVGTPGYLAPEIIRDEEITQAADVHALAATVFFAAVGEPPFGTGAFEKICYNILEGKANIDRAPAWLRPWLRAALDGEARNRPSARALLRMAAALDPAVTELHEDARDGGTKILGKDGTRLLEEPARPPRDRTRVLSDDFSDLLTPVQYVEPERPARPPRQAKPAKPAAPPRQVRQAAVAPPPYRPAAYPPPPYPDQRVAGPPPPPYPDQRVAGPPRPRSAPAAPPPPAERVRPYPPQDRPRYRTGHPFLAALLLTSLVALACVLPVAVGTLAVVIALCLRVGEYLWGGLAQRRSVRGASAGDPLLVLLGTPWALIKAGLATLVTVPLAAMFGTCVWGALYYLGGMDGDAAAAYATGAFTAGLFVLPGGGAPRRAVARTLTGAIRSPGAAMIVAIIFGTLAFFTVMAAVTGTPSWMPWQPPSEVINELARKGQDTAMGLVSGVLDSLMDTLGLGFLTFWA